MLYVLQVMLWESYTHSKYKGQALVAAVTQRSMFRCLSLPTSPYSKEVSVVSAKGVQ